MILVSLVQFIKLKEWKPENKLKFKYNIVHKKVKATPSTS